MRKTGCQTLKKLIDRVNEADDFAQDRDVTLVHHDKGEDKGVDERSDHRCLTGHQNTTATRGQGQQNTGGQDEKEEN